MEKGEKRVLQFRKRTCAGSHGLGGDAVISLTSHGKTRTQVLCVSLRQTLMDKCRWRNSDRVFVDFEADRLTAAIRLTRTDDRKNGYALSCSKGENGGAVVKMTIDPEDVRVVFPEGNTSPLVCTLIRGDANMAELAIDYA